MEYQSSLESGDYVAPAYEFPDSVKNFQLLPRFGHGSDITVLFSSNRDDQVDYAAGLITLFAFLLMFFMFWTMMIITFKVMGPSNAGFLSGYHFVVPDPADDVKDIRKRYVFCEGFTLSCMKSILKCCLLFRSVDRSG
jgi:hypothetical protein